MDKDDVFSNVVVAIDGSDESIKAANYGIKIAKRNNAKLLILHVIHVPAAGLMYTTESAFKEFVEKRKSEANDWFVDIKKKSSENGVQVNVEIVEEIYSIAGAIIKYAEKKNADLIIVGGTGRSGFKRLLLGSVASDVVGFAKCPVLVIR